MLKNILHLNISINTVFMDIYDWALIVNKIEVNNNRC